MADMTEVEFDCENIVTLMTTNQLMAINDKRFCVKKFVCIYVNVNGQMLLLCVPWWACDGAQQVRL